MIDEDKRQQVLDQCKAVHHMAMVIMKLYEPSQLPSIYAAPNCTVLDIAGRRTAELMEFLGDTLNGMDAVEYGDDWMTPIFERAHQMFPVRQE